MWWRGNTMSSLPPGVTDAMCEANCIDEHRPCGSCGHTLEFHDEEKFCQCCGKDHDVCRFIEACAKHWRKKTTWDEKELCVIAENGCTKECECKTYNADDPWDDGDY